MRSAGNRGKEGRTRYAEREYVTDGKIVPGTNPKAVLEQRSILILEPALKAM